MSAGCVRLVLSRTLRAACGGSSSSSSSPVHWAQASRLTIHSERSHLIAYSRRWSPFCTAVDATEQTPAPKKKKKQDPRDQAAIGAVGRNIPHRLIHVIGDTGDNMGTMHRADVIKLMNEQGLKLVLLRANQDPPVYKLMSGKQIHEEQLKLREKQKAKAAPVQVKELTFSTGIAAHDLTTKLKQVESWLEKKHHVRITLRAGRRETVANLDLTLEQMVQQMEVTVGFVTKPSVIREGQAAMCVLRPPSAKELSQIEKKKAAALQPDKTSGRKTPPVGGTDTTEGSIQQ